MDKVVFNKLNSFFDYYNNMDKWVVIDTSGNVIADDNGNIALSLEEASDIAMAYKNMGGKISIMRYNDFKHGRD